MIYRGTQVVVIDNSGARKANCFAVYSVGQYAGVGDTVMVSIRSAVPNGKVQVGQKYKAMVVRTVNPIRRAGGDSVSFPHNAVVLLQPSGELFGTRISGVVPRETPQKVRSSATGVC